MLTVAKAMNLDPEKTTMRFALRWSRLSEREISDWAHQNRMISPNRIARADQVLSEVAVPLRTPVEDLPRLVRTAVRPLFRTFGWEEEDPNIIPELAARLLNRNA